MTTIAPAADKLLVYDQSAGDYGAATIFQAVASVISGGGSELTIVEDSSSGLIKFSFDSSSLVKVTRQVVADYGLSGGGSLSGDIQLSVDLGDMTISAAVDVDNDLLAYYDVSAGVTRTATIPDITDQIVSAKPLGSIA